MSGPLDRRGLARGCDWLLAGLVAVVVVVDGTAAAGITLLPVDYGFVRLALFGVALAAAVVGSLAAGLRSPAYAALGLVGLPVALVYGVTGVVLPWDQFAYWVASTLLEVVASIPLAGGFLARLLFGGVTLNQGTLTRAFAVHYALVGLAAVALAGAIGRAGWRRHASGARSAGQ